MARPATKRIKFGTSEKARRKTNHFINAILRAFDGIIAHAPHLRSDQRQATIDVLAPGVKRVNEALVDPPQVPDVPSFALPE